MINGDEGREPAVAAGDPFVWYSNVPPWGYTSRPEWSSPGESMWMRLSKFSLCNRMPLLELAALFSARDPSSSKTDAVAFDFDAPDFDPSAQLTRLDLRIAEPWDMHALGVALNISIDDVRAGFSRLVASPSGGRACDELRYCAACLDEGFHAAWFQWPHIERCPLHHRRVRTGCPRCGARVPYLLGPDLASRPLTCTVCTRSWVPRLSAPGGRCRPLRADQIEVVARWSAYVANVVASDVRPRRDPVNGKFADLRAPSVSARTHHLTAVNRLFDLPPPVFESSLCELQAQCELPQAERWHDMVDDALPCAFDRALWPHFNEAFCVWQRLILAAGRQLFPGAPHEQGAWQHLLASGMVANTDEMSMVTAAALGWSGSWIGSAQTLSPRSRPATPAMGLAMWLANLPASNANPPPADDRVRISRWLLGDLCLTAQIWMDVAFFMRDQGVYLLHGAMVDPGRFARLHRRTH